MVSEVMHHNGNTASSAMCCLSRNVYRNLCCTVIVKWAINMAFASSTTVQLAYSTVERHTAAHVALAKHSASVRTVN